MKTCTAAWCLLTALSLLMAPARADDAEFQEPAPNVADEPRASEFSLTRAVEFLDAASTSWTRQRKCGTCHTNYAFLFARPAVPGPASRALAEVRTFFENRARHWETAKPKWDTEVVATAVALAVSDAGTTGKLHPMTRKALDGMWKLQREDGSWDWLKCNWPPMEHDDYFGAVYAAIGVGSAPEDYASSELARAGLEKLRAYLRQTPAPDLHHRAMLLWASTRLGGLLQEPESKTIVDELWRQQKPDGSWSIHSLASWKRHDGSANDASRGDAYGTALATYVLRQTGSPATDERLQKAVHWLRGDQRASGRWFLRSPSNDNHHFISHAATAYAVMAIQACAPAPATARI